MPEFQLDFNVVISHLNGTITVAADSLEEAIRQVQEDVDLDELIDMCGSQETTVDAWPAGGEEKEDV